MLRFLKKTLVIFVLGALAQQASAFTLIGLAPAWQTTAIGYNWETVGAVSTIGGPMNLGEEYRWNVPNLYYAVDSSFLNYFGTRGAQEIDKAIKIINDLPPMSQININDFPLKSERINYQAQALGLVDLKTSALQSLVTELGLTDPEEWVFTLRSRWTTPGSTNYYILKRNFDPVTLAPSSYINGDLWTFVGMVENQNVPIAYPIKSRVDPLSYGDPVASSESSFANASSPVGLFYNGLTRDDVGGLRYIYHPGNLNVENPVANVFPGTGGGPVLSGGTSGNFVWEPLFLNSTNGTTTQTPGGNLGSPWDPVLIQNTNNPTGTAPGGGTTPTPPPVVGNFINTGLRPGVDKIRLIKVQFDSLLGQFVSPVLDGFNDTILTYGTPVSQSLLRIITQPDILFTAADLFGNSDSTMPWLRMSRNEIWTNNAAINQAGAPAQATPGSGPGTINPGIVIAFNNAGPMIWDGFFGAFNNLDEANPFAQSPLWGSFDGTTNAPVIYPNNVAIEDIERQALGR